MATFGVLDDLDNGSDLKKNVPVDLEKHMQLKPPDDGLSEIEFYEYARKYLGKTFSATRHIKPYWEQYCQNQSQSLVVIKLPKDISIDGTSIVSGDYDKTVTLSSKHPNYDEIVCLIFNNNGKKQLNKDQKKEKKKEQKKAQKKEEYFKKSNVKKRPLPDLVDAFEHSHDSDNSDSD